MRLSLLCSVASVFLVTGPRSRKAKANFPPP